MGSQEELLAAPDHSDQDHHDLGGTQAEGEEAEGEEAEGEEEQVLLREDQMRGRQGKKATRGQKTKGGKGKKKVKGKSTKRRSKAGHRLAVLKASPKKRCKTGDDGDDTAPVKKRAPKKATAEPRGTPSPKPKPKGKAKAQAKGNGEVEQKAKVRVPKAKAAPKAKVEASEAAAPKRRRRETRSQPQPALEARADLFNQDTLDSILEFASQFDQQASLDETKRKVKFLLGNSWCCKLNIYWSRAACGVKVLKEFQKDSTKPKDFAYFKFPDTYPVILSLVVAVRCAELLVTW